MKGDGRGEEWKGDKRDKECKGDKSYACHQCNKGCTLLHRPKIHIWLTWEQPHEYLQCNVIFTVSSWLKTPMAEETG